MGDWTFHHRGPLGLLLIVAAVVVAVTWWMRSGPCPYCSGTGSMADGCPCEACEGWGW